MLCSYGGGIVEGISDYGAELMLYQATIIKYVRDFHGPAWAQYDRAYRSQVAQTKDLRWSRLNPTLYSLCFAGKAKHLVVSAHCLSDSHATDQCPENMDIGAALMSWQQQGVVSPIPTVVRSATRVTGWSLGHQGFS